MEKLIRKKELYIQNSTWAIHTKLYKHIIKGGETKY